MFIDRKTYEPADLDDLDAGGWVHIDCDCGYNGYVECDDTGRSLLGNCEDCDVAFEEMM